MNEKLVRTLLLLSVVLNVGLGGVLIQQLRETVPTDLIETDTEPIEKVHTNGTYPFIRVIDGDTVAVLLAGKEERVRLIGINAPEPNDPGGPECYAEEATRHLRELAKTGMVDLTFDESQGARDVYGRLLAYVSLPDGDDLGERMLREGYAHEYTYDTPYVRLDTYKAAEAEAIEARSGLWADEACSNSE